MRKLFIQLIAIVCMAVISVDIQAQTNGSFENLTGTNFGSAFANNQVTGWQQSHGTPSIFGGAPGQGQRSAWMWSYSGRGEGIVQNYSFAPGSVYTVTFWVRTNNPDGKFYVQAANNVPNGTTTSTAFPSVSSKQLIYSSGLVFNNWQKITVTFTPNTTYSQLWIYPYLSSRPTNGQAEVQVDGIDIDVCSPVSVLVPNYSFEKMSGTDRVRPFSNGQVPGWTQSHGTPSMFGGAPGQGKNSAWMWSYSGRGEGIVTKVNFKVGTTYQIKFWVRTAETDGVFYFKAANGVPSGTSTSVVIPNVSSQQTIVSSGLTFSKWVEKTVIFTANDNYDQLWIYPLLKGLPTQGQAELQVDAIRIETVCKGGETIEENIDLPIEKKEVKEKNTEQALAVKVYPNPATTQVTVLLPETSAQGEVVIYDLNSGQKVASFTVTSARNQWQVPATLKAGTYQMIVTDPVSQMKKTTRIVIEK